MEMGGLEGYGPQTLKTRREQEENYGMGFGC